VATSLGYADGEQMPFLEYLMIIQRIVASVDIPVTIDMEMGYGKTPEEIYANIEKLINAGVAGINIEDSVIINGTRSLKDASEFARTIDFIRNKLTATHQSIFINVRCDTFLLKVKDAETETAHRLNIYESAGADGIFLPFIHDEWDIVKAVSKTHLPLNVMAMPGIPDLKRLSQFGVKRLSMGPFFHTQVYRKAKELAASVAETNSLQLILQ
jgi:2-methylisocitrate lyase-like PEP mutase family enzyme